MTAVTPHIRDCLLSVSERPNYRHCHTDTPLEERDRDKAFGGKNNRASGSLRANAYSPCSEQTREEVPNREAR